ncbi:hypothetical protein [Nonomuraea sp. NPDC023979]|uniref:hypothetical protein n=1 Tax=Nonomuraea sp. NPDC023979 TaxID=3154796 RepID=UPI0033D12E76
MSLGKQPKNVDNFRVEGGVVHCQHGPASHIPAGVNRWGNAHPALWGCCSGSNSCRTVRADAVPLPVVGEEVSEWTFTKHALGRALDRLVTPEEIRACLESPALVYSQSGPYKGRTVRQAGRVALVVDVESKTVLSVVFKQPADWTPEDQPFVVQDKGAA